MLKKIGLSLTLAVLELLAVPAQATEESSPPVISVKAPGGPAQPPAEVRTEAASPALGRSTLTFMDSKLFDMKLGKEMEEGRDVVEVDISGRVPLSNIPSRLDNWVVHSAEEGKVAVLPVEQAPKTRAIFSLIPMIFNALGFLSNMQQERMFNQAKNYDTIIYYRKDETGETLIDRIVMTRRKKN